MERKRKLVVPETLQSTSLSKRSRNEGGTVQVDLASSLEHPTPLSEETEESDIYRPRSTINEHSLATSSMNHCDGPLPQRRRSQRERRLPSRLINSSSVCLSNDRSTAKRKCGSAKRKSNSCCTTKRVRKKRGVTETIVSHRPTKQPTAGLNRRDSDIVKSVTTVRTGTPQRDNAACSTVQKLEDKNRLLETEKEKLERKNKFLEEELKEIKYQTKGGLVKRNRILESSRCAICHHKITTWPSVVAFDPCGHSYCGTCADRFVASEPEKKCPTCRVKYVKFLKIFI